MCEHLHLHITQNDGILKCIDVTIIISPLSLRKFQQKKFGNRVHAAYQISSKCKTQITSILLQRRRKFGPTLETRSIFWFTHTPVPVYCSKKCV